MANEDSADVVVRTETDSLGEVQVPADKLWGAQHIAHYISPKLLRHVILCGRLNTLISS
jgi:hypothetical protein